MAPETAQIKRISQLETIIQSLQEKINSMEAQTARVEHFENRVAQIELRTESEGTRSVSSPHPLTPFNSDKLKVVTPEKYDGNPAGFDVFCAALTNFFVLKASVFVNDEVKVRSIGTFLSKQALTWFSTLIRTDSPLLKDYQAFMLEFKRLFSDPNAKMKAQLQLKRLQQGSGSTLNYSVKFRSLMADTGYNDEALMAQFRA